jgi:hypothetical protein
MAPMMVLNRTRAFRSVFAGRRAALGFRLLGNVRRLNLMIFSAMRHRGRRIIGGKRNVDVLLSRSRKGQASREEDNRRQRKDRLHFGC